MITYKKFVLNDYKDSLIVTDDKLSELYGIRGGNVYLLPQGENAKSFDNVERLCKWFLSKLITRSGSVVAVGGGSVGDTVGFAASIYKRGVRLTHVPTTLLAQIDSSIGGKTALDLDGVKNAVGTFYNADTVIDVDFLKTLDKLQMLSGSGELLKYRMLSNDVNAAYRGEITAQVIKACVDCKQSLCAVDPFDCNERRKLNFGHTVGHAMELTYGLPHGHAVANGIYYEMLLAYKLNKCAREYLSKWTEEIERQFEIFALNEQILNLTINDKKNDGDSVCFVLPSQFEQHFLTLNQLKSILCYD